MSIGTRFVSGTQVAFINGAIAPGAILKFYLTGTSTPTPWYSDVGLTVPNAVPAVANGAGLLPDIYLDPAVTYRTVLTDSSGANALVSDNVSSNVSAIAAGLNLGTAATEDTGAVGHVLPFLDTGNQWDAQQIYNDAVFLEGGGAMTPRASPTSADLGWLGWPQVVLGVPHVFNNQDSAKNIVFTGNFNATIPVGLFPGAQMPGLLLRATWLAGTGGGQLIQGAGVTLRWPNGNVTGNRTVAGPGFIVLEQMLLNEWWVVGGAGVS